jgi:ketosteroid isomerase-like protein
MILPAKVFLVVVILSSLATAQQGTSTGLGSAPLTPSTPTEAQSPERTAIQRLLNSQVAAWNRGDLDGFMEGYLHSPRLTFFSNDSETHGWQPTLDRYKKRYQGEGHAMGQLDFQDLRIEMLDTEAAFVRGKWHLKMPDGKDLQGMFTLVIRHFPNDGWKIVHDHSSGA